jgi:uncharacterized protein YfkK (UPF0435 family)
MQNILKVLIIAKQEFKQIPKNSYNPYHKSKYANLDAVLEAISESLNKYNLCLLQPTEVRDDRTILKTLIYHVESGEQISSELLLPQNAEPQKTGSAITYYRRYALCSLLGIIADEDDDAQLSRTENPTMQPPQAAELVRTGFTGLNHTQAGNTTRSNSINTSQTSKSRPQNIPSNDEEEKARAIYAEMKKINLSPEAMLKIALTKFNSTNVRSLSWQQIEQLKSHIKTEGKNHSQSNN